MSLYQNKYRIESARLKEWNYSSPWYYYVTINTKNHIHFFGKIEQGKVILNSLGKIVDTEWLKTKDLRPNTDLDYYIIMPNHLHGIIIINNVETAGQVVSKNAGTKETMRRIVSTTTLQSDSLGSIIGQFKSICTKQIRVLGQNNFSWQRGFYDRIIRNEKELYNIRKYIDENPIRWELEKDLPENLELQP